MRLSYQPDGYRCPFCRVAAGEDLRDDFTNQADVIFRDDVVTAFISSAWWPANPGHVLVVPNDHVENVYDIPDAVLAAVQVIGKRIGLALVETYDYDGTSFRQHNGPGGDQEVWHYHLHVFPRYRGDDLYVRTMERRDTTPWSANPTHGSCVITLNSSDKDRLFTRRSGTTKRSAIGRQVAKESRRRDRSHTDYQMNLQPGHDWHYIDGGWSEPRVPTWII